MPYFVLREYSKVPLWIFCGPNVNILESIDGGRIKSIFSSYISQLLMCTLVCFLLVFVFVFTVVVFFLFLMLKFRQQPIQDLVRQKRYINGVHPDITILVNWA